MPAAGTVLHGGTLPLAKAEAACPGSGEQAVCATGAVFPFIAGAVGVGSAVAFVGSRNEPGHAAPGGESAGGGREAGSPCTSPSPLQQAAWHAPVGPAKPPVPALPNAIAVPCLLHSCTWPAPSPHSGPPLLCPAGQLPGRQPQWEARLLRNPAPHQRWAIAALPTACERAELGAGHVKTPCCVGPPRPGNWRCRPDPFGLAPLQTAQRTNPCCTQQ